MSLKQSRTIFGYYQCVMPVKIANKNPVRYQDKYANEL